MSNSSPIGIFDSGIGGLSVWREIARQLPHEDTIYFADQIHIPYGPRSLAGNPIVLRSDHALSCSSVAQDHRRGLQYRFSGGAETSARHFPDVPFVGMEPAVKPAAETTRTGVVGVLATPATFQGELFASVVERFANGVKLINQVCPGLGGADRSRTVEHARNGGDARSVFGADPIERTQIRSCWRVRIIRLSSMRFAQLAPGVNVIDPAPAVARQVDRVLRERGLLCAEDRVGQHRFVTSGDLDRYQEILRLLVNVETPGQRAMWSANRQLLLE